MRIQRGLVTVDFEDGVVSGVVASGGRRVRRHHVAHRCIVSTHMTDYFGKIDAEACAAARGVLQRHSLADALDEIRAMAASGR